MQQKTGERFPAVSLKGSGAAVLAATIGASSMAFIDGSIVPIALPAIQGDLGADFATLQWIVNIYTLFLGALVLVGGAYGDTLGRRRIFLIGTVLFVAASALCGLAPTSALLVAGRALQGIGAALMVPQSLAIISASFPEATRGRAIGTWTAASALTTSIGPPLGGLLIDLLSWRAAFLINLPIGVAVIWLTLTRVPETRSGSTQAVDLAGGVLATVGLGALTAALVYWPTRGIGDLVVGGGFAVAAVTLVAFVAWEARARAPIMPLGLFRDPVFAGINLLTVLLYGALSGALFLAPYTLIGLYGYTATEAGLSLLPMGIAIALFARRFGAIGDRIGPKLPMVGGAVVVALSFAWFGWTEAAGGYWVGVFGPMLGIGLGMAAAISPLTTTVMNAVEDRLSGTASGINNAAARIAGLLAVAVTGALMTVLYSRALATSLPTLGLDAGIAPKILAAADRLLDVPLPSGLAAEAAARLKAALGAAYAEALRAAILMNAALAAAAALIGAALPLKAGAGPRHGQR